MNFQKTILLLAIVTLISSCKNEKTNSEIVDANTEVKTEASVKIIPIKHGTLVIETKNEVIYVDPTGGADAFKEQKSPTIILITDIHGDHLSTKTLEALNLENVSIVVPKAVANKIPSTLIKSPLILNNNESTEINKINIEAIPMYNLREEALKYHEKGRGNGYILTINDERIYISGDTEDIPEMRNLKNIDKAFVCMNLPWTMTIESAASAVLEFKPKYVYPYHYRGNDGLSDINKFKDLVNKGDKSIEVLFLDWYK